MNQSDAMQAVQVAIEANVPVLLWGEPGSGKTSAVQGLAAALGWPIETVLASLREPSDFAGLPVLVDGEVTFAPPDWARRLSIRTRGICFFDELSTAAPSTQKALLRVVHERVVGDLSLGEGIRMIAAANPADVATGGWDLSPALANRFLHLTWDVDPAIVAAGLFGTWPDPAPLHIDPDWRTRIAAHRAIVSGFVSARPVFAHARPADTGAAGMAWPSPRTWEALVSVLAVADGAAVSPTARIALVAGLVGDGAAVEFLQYERDLDLPDPERLLADPARYRRPDRDDQVHAVVAAVASAVLGRLTPERWTASIEVFSRIAAAGNLDIAAVGVRAVVAARPADAVVPSSIEVFAAVLQTAGMIPGKPARRARAGAGTRRQTR